MANRAQLYILKQGVDVWNQWRERNRSAEIDLSGADLEGATLDGVHFGYADLSHANLEKARLPHAGLKCVDLRGANLIDAFLLKAFLKKATMDGANFTRANLLHADMSEATLNKANLTEATLIDVKFNHSDMVGAILDGAFATGCDFESSDLTDATLINVNLMGSRFVNTKVDRAKISGSFVHGSSVWDLQGEFKEQHDLVITPEDAPVVTVDNLKVAQFIYLILNNEEIRHVLDTLTSKSVLILGRFALPERKTILDALRNELRAYDLLPIVFDFDRPTDKDFTETIKTLAGLSYFVIVDVTSPRSSPLELQAIVPDYQIPFVPIIQEGETPFAMMKDLQQKYNWVLQTVEYDSMKTLLRVLKPLIIDPAMKKRQELRIIKAQQPEIISAREFLAKAKD